MILIYLSSSESIEERMTRDYNRYKASDFRNHVFFMIHEKNHISSIFEALKLILCQIRLKQWFYYVCITYEWIWECPNQDCSNAWSVRFSRSVIWSFIMIRLRVSLYTMHNQTFHLDRDLSRIWMYQGKILWAHLNSGILSYDQKCHACFRLCRTFERFTRSSDTQYYSIALTVNSEEQCSTSHLFVCLFVCLWVCVFVCSFVYSFVLVCLFVCLFFCLDLCFTCKKC